MLSFNDLFPTIAPDVWRALDILDRHERLPDRVDAQVRADEERVQVVAMLPGIDRESLVVEVEDGTLHIHGKRRQFAPDQARTLRSERERGGFEYWYRLPYEVEEQRAEADYVDGVLTISLPRAEASKPQRITVKSTPAIEQK
ncbi:MAG: Hsp20/alpha crystallin family protein [Planctomycetota bacterium]